MLVAYGRAAVLVALLCATAACGPRPRGDFGRAQPGVLHDEIMPAIGSTRAQIAGEPVSSFNLTDQEREMHDRVWRFLVAPHAHDWFFEFAAELQRTRLSGASDHKFAPNRYYRWLQQRDFASSRVRYGKLGEHIQADLDTLPTTFLAICAVLEIDRRRGIAVAEISGLTAEARADAAARRHENAVRIDWFVRAVAYRHASYGFALDHLLVETPHEEAVLVDAMLSELGTYVAWAQRGEFCTGATGQIYYKDRPAAVALPSRIGMPAAAPEGRYRK